MCRLLLGCVPKLRGKLQRTGKFSERHYQLSLSKKESLSVEILTSRRHAVWWFLRLEIVGVDHKPYKILEQFLLH